jgi:spermidine synthase
MMSEEKWVKDSWDEKEGRGLSVKIKKTLDSYRSKYQDLDMYETACFGKMLTLDGTIMFTEFDEFAYHEMIAHVPMCTHPAPEKVLIIGGGDGGVAREVLKHKSVKEVHLCEIDEEVINITKKHVPKLASGFNSPKMKIFVEDGAAFIGRKKNTYDVIIVDSSDPWGPAQVLFRKEFYKIMFEALTKDGIVVTQSESMFYNRELIKKLITLNRTIYPIAEYFYTIVPTYPSGVIGFSFCSKKFHPLKHARDKKITGLKYYDPEIHRAAFVLPKFMKDLLLKK